MDDHDTNQAVFVDAHCHLDLYRDPPAIVRGAEQQRVQTVAVTNAPSVFFHTCDLARGTVYIQPAIGLHPELVHSHGHELPGLLEALATTTFVGEVGLDYQTSDPALRKRQQEVFSAVLDRCASLRGRVLTVHSRRAAADVIALIGADYPCSVILHWFSGSKRELRRAVENGLYFSVNPAMARSRSGMALLAEMPRDRVLTETDGPFVELEGRPATPACVAHVVEVIAAVWREPPEAAAQSIASNFARLTQPSRSS